MTTVNSELRVEILMKCYRNYENKMTKDDTWTIRKSSQHIISKGLMAIPNIKKLLVVHKDPLPTRTSQRIHAAVYTSQSKKSIFYLRNNTSSKTVMQVVPGLPKWP